VTSIAVVGMSCAAGQTVANGYHGLIGSFKAYGFACVAAQGSPQSRGSVRCVKRHRRTTYNTAPPTDSSMTPGSTPTRRFSGRVRGPTTLAARRPSRCSTPPRRRPAPPRLDVLGRQPRQTPRAWCDRGTRSTSSNGPPRQSRP